MDDYGWNELGVIGDRERVISWIESIQDMGYDNLLCDFGFTREMPINEMTWLLKFLVTEVMPAFR